MADYSDLPFNTGDTDYPTQATTLLTRNQDITTEVNNARQGSTNLNTRIAAFNTELTAAREGESNLVTNLQNNYWKNAAFTSSADLNNKKIIGALDGTSPTDAVTLSQAQAINALGVGEIDQSLIAITDLAAGTATTGQRIVIDDLGLAVVGEDNVILTLDSGGLTANQLVGADNIATALEAKDLSNISTGSLTVSEGVRVNATSSGLESHETVQPEVQGAYYF